MNDEFDFDNNNYDPLAQLEETLNAAKVHLRIQKRNARKVICTIEGLEMNVDQLKDVLKTMKKNFACNGTLVDSKEFGKVIQLQGDIREQAKELLINKYNIDEDNIITHGYD